MSENDLSPDDAHIALTGMAVEQGRLRAAVDDLSARRCQGFSPASSCRIPVLKFLRLSRRLLLRQSLLQEMF